MTKHCILYLIISAVPILIYLYRRYAQLGDRQDSILSCVFASVALLNLFSQFYLQYYIPDFLIRWIMIAAMVLHWGTWLWMAFKCTDARAHALPLITVWLLLVVHSLYLGSIIAAIIATLYSLVCIYLYKPEKKQENDDNLNPA